MFMLIVVCPTLSFQVDSVHNHVDILVEISACLIFGGCSALVNRDSV
jgi:hypothetical protein